MMKINNINSYNTHTKNNINFKKGLPKRFLNLSQNANPKEIETQLLNKGIKASFWDLPSIAVCCKKTIDIMENYGFIMPKAFNLEIMDKSIVGVTECVSHTISFNLKRPEFFDLNVLNIIEENRSKNGKFQNSGHFLHAYLHEFSHMAHFNNLCENWGQKEAENIFDKMENYEPKDAMLGIFYAIFKSLKIPININPPNGRYAKTDLCEYVAEKNSRLIAEDLGKKLTIKNKNQPPILNPQNYYNKFEKILSKLNLPFSEDLLELTTKYDKAIWNGELDKLDDLLKHK